MTKQKPIVLIDETIPGRTQYMFNGDVDFYFLDDNCPNDRVYQFTIPTKRSIIRDLIGDEPVGHMHDGSVAFDALDFEVETDRNADIDPKTIAGAG